MVKKYVDAAIFKRLIQMSFKSVLPYVSATALCLASCTTTDIKDDSSLKRVALPLGAALLEQTWRTEEIAKGLWRHEIVRAPAAPASMKWTWRSQPLLTEAARNEALNCLGATSVSTNRASYPYPGNARQTYEIVRAGDYQSRKTAISAFESETLHDCNFQPQRLNDTPAFEEGPWLINILELDLDRFDGRIALGLAGEKVAGLEPVTTIAARKKALAAINASFFVISDEDGVVGDITGLSVFNGTLISEGLIGRSALLLRNGARHEAMIGTYSPSVKLKWPDGDVIVADGVNRRPGFTRNCGNMGDVPTSLSVHDVTCTDASELIVFDEYSGFEPDAADALTLTVTESGAIRSGASDAWSQGDGYLVVATGDRANEITQKLDAHNAVEITIGDVDEQAPRYAINGAPMLLSGGFDVDMADQEGWPLSVDTPPSQADAIHRWINERNPRTAAGITQDGRLLLVTVDGRQPEHSVGATIQELRALMRSIGAFDAINLDGGGSTTMVIGGSVINKPSDLTGPRAVADALLLLPSAQ